MCKSNGAVLKRNILKSEISQSKLQDLEGRDLIPGLEILCKFVFVFVFLLECIDNSLFLQNLGRKLAFDCFVLLSLENEN